ncbi:MAG: tetratricopeptide repeat protein [Thermoanaerobaculia bacterium]
MGRHRHISRDVLLAARRGELSGDDLVERLVARLAELCPVCRDEILTADAAGSSEAGYSEESYQEPVARALQIGEDLALLKRDAASVPELLGILRGLSVEQRDLRIRNAPDRFGNRSLGEELLDQARACLPDDPEGSLGWARTVETVAEAYPTPYPPHEVLALAYQGNAHRAIGDFDRARRHLLRARELAERAGGVDLDVTAELDSFFGSLDTDLSRFPEAAETLERAAELFGLLGEDERRARVLIKLGVLRALMGDLPAALETDRAAVALLVPEESPSLYLAGRLNFAVHLADAGEPLAAREVLESELERYRQAGAFLRVRFDALRARLSVELGDPAGAESMYRKVLEEFERQRQGFSAAHVCLELGALYLEQGRFDDLEEIAAQAVALFEVHETHREALAALALLHEATRARRLTSGTLQRIGRFLERAQRDPAARRQQRN